MVAIPRWLFYVLCLYAVGTAVFVGVRLWCTRPRVAPPAPEPSDPWARYTERAKRPLFPGLN